MTEQVLERRILEKMISQLELEDVEIEGFDYETPIFLADETDVPGLGLDSVDALELVVMLHEEFGLKVPVEDMVKLRTVRAVADYVREKGADEQ
ncbi:MAG: acyl carrier protein [Blautia sp.]|jgi:acyl carrier protein